MNRAISPVIAVILLVLIAISITVSFFSWYKSMKSLQEETGEKTQSRIFKEAIASIKILDIRNVSGSYRVVVFNNGDIKLTDIMLYVDGKLDSGNLSSLGVNEIGEITSSLITQPGEYELKVTSKEGASYTCKKEI